MLANWHNYNVFCPRVTRGDTGEQIDATKSHPQLGLFVTLTVCVMAWTLILTLMY